MRNEIDVCKDIIIKMIKENKIVNIASKEYIRFNEVITKFVFDNNLDATEEWNLISNSMIYTSFQTFDLQAANNILIGLEKLKRLYLKNKREEVIFDEHVHSLISKVSKKNYFEGNYADAVENAFKEINTRCKNIYKKRTGIELDGADLMNKIFSANNPILMFQDNSNETGKNVQLGYMQIFAGAMIGIRNPKAHANEIISKEDAFKRIIFASLLMDKIDEAEEYEKLKCN